MRGIPLRGQANAPSFVGVDRRVHVVVILALRVDELAETARVIDLAHGVEVVVEARMSRTSCSSARTT